MIADQHQDTIHQLLLNRGDPYRLLAHLLEDRPVEFIEPGFWLIHEYEKVAEILSSRDAFSVDVRLATGIADTPPDDLLLRTKRNMLTFSDDPYHRSLRRIINRAFSPKQIEKIRNDLYSYCRSLVQKLEVSERVDFVTDYAQYIPPATTTMLLGLPLSVASEIQEWAQRLVQLGRMFDMDVLSGVFTKRRYEHSEHDEERLSTIVVIEEFLQYAEKLLARNISGSLGNSVLALLVAELNKNDGLPRNVLRSLTLNILSGGQQGTTRAIGNAFLALVDHPGQLSDLLATDSPAYWENAMNELLRFRGPFLTLRRVVTRNITIGDAMIRNGEVVLLCVASANHDPKIFAEPEMLKLTRPNANKQLSIGRGSHVCIGAALGMIEMQTALRSWFDAFPNTTIAEPPELAPTPISLGYRSIPVTMP